MHTEIEKMMETEMKEFDKQFVDENLWQGEDEYTKNVPIGNIKSFILSSNRRLLAKVKKRLHHEILAGVNEKHAFYHLDDIQASIFNLGISHAQDGVLRLLTLPEDKKPPLTR